MFGSWNVLRKVKGKSNENGFSHVWVEKTKEKESPKKRVGMVVFIFFSNR